MFRYALRNLLQNKIRLVISVGGVALALSLTFLLSVIIPNLGSNLALQISGASLLKVGVVSLVIAALSAVLPIRQIAGLDPAIVFKGA